jgi:hypothetical protein
MWREMASVTLCFLIIYTHVYSGSLMILVSMTGFCQRVGAPPASRIERLSRRTGRLYYVILVGGVSSARRYALDEMDSC